MDSKALLIGDAVHQALELFWRGESLEAAIERVTGVCVGSFWESDTGQLERTRVEIMLNGYWKSWADARSEWEFVDSEAVIWTNYDERAGLVLAGKIDALARYLPDGRLFMVEHKTSSEPASSTGDDYWQRLKIDSQVSLYKMILERQLGEPIYVLYDVLRKISKKPKLLAGVRKRRDESAEEWERRKAESRETLPDFAARMLQEIDGEQQKWFVRREIHRLDTDHESFWSDLQATMGEMFGRENQTYPRNDAACMARFGTCPYLDVCTGTMTLDDPRFAVTEDVHPELGGALSNIPSNVRDEPREHIEEQNNVTTSRDPGPCPF
jgi:hypothetical protein